MRVGLADLQTEMADGINIVHVAQSIADFIKQERVQDGMVIKELRQKLIRGGKIVPPLAAHDNNSN